MEKEVKKLADAIYEGNRDKAKQVAQTILEKKIDPVEAIETGLAPKMKEIGDKFERLEIFLPEVMLSAEAMAEALEVLRPAISKERISDIQQGIVIMGTVKGDIHDIGKNIVSMLLSTAGFKVIDVGKDAAIEKYIEAALQNDATIIGVSTLLTSCRGYVKELVEELESKNLRSKFKLMAGGGGLTAEWSERAGYDGFADNGTQAVELAKRLSKGV